MGLVEGMDRNEISRLSQQKSVTLTKSRADYGVATNADWLQARQVMDSAQAEIPELDRQISRMEDAISILLGDYPEDVPRGAILTEQQMPPAVPAGLTSALLERRPDIRKAEKLLAEYNAEISVARAEFFPQISLTASGGRSIALTSLLTSQTSIWSRSSGRRCSPTPRPSRRRLGTSPTHWWMFRNTARCGSRMKSMCAI